MMFMNDEENDILNPEPIAGAIGKAPTQAAPESPLPGDPMAEILKQQKAAQEKKGYLTAIGSALDNFQSVPSSFELLYGGKAQAPTAGKAMSDLSATMGDPLANQEKAMAYLKQKRDMTRTQDADLPGSSDSKTYADQISAMFPKLAPVVNGKSKAQIEQMMPLLSQKIRGDVDRENKLAEIAASKDADLRNKRIEIKDKHADEKSEGRKAVDKDYAKDYNDWTSSGRAVLEKNLGSLEEAAKALDADPSLSGGLTGALGDRWTADRVLKQRQKVNSAIQNSMKATLGAQFTEKEGERVLKNAYNEAASPETNKESLRTTINMLRQQATNNEAKAKHFEQNGTLSGYQGTLEKKKEALTPQTKVVNGVTYRRVDGGWEEVTQVGQQ